jgi:hypothetical protein
MVILTAMGLMLIVSGAVWLSNRQRAIAPIYIRVRNRRRRP